MDGIHTMAEWQRHQRHCECVRLLGTGSKGAQYTHLAVFNGNVKLQQIFGRLHHAPDDRKQVLPLHKLEVYIRANKVVVAAAFSTQMHHRREKQIMSARHRQWNGACAMRI